LRFGSAGVGSKVRLYLPRADEQTVEVANAPPMPVFDPRGSETILLVDDYQTLMQVTRRHLMALGYGVIAAPGVPSALAILESGETVDRSVVH
jgi:two-component system, cell cycle sensor histidine kinase and response regulator CckA